MNDEENCLAIQTAGGMWNLGHDSATVFVWVCVCGEDVQQGSLWPRLT